MNKKKILSSVIVALDVNTLTEAERLLKLLSPYFSQFKVGLELLTAEGAKNVVALCHKYGVRPFYDGKLDDIPATVGKTSAIISTFGVKLFNVHASAGIDSMRAAVENAGTSKVFAVTVLTSIDEENCISIYGMSSKAKVLQMGREAFLAGCHGIICSPQELVILRKAKELDDMEIITPGIRPLYAAADDQKRIMTPSEAIKAGATGIVIGRPITNPPNNMTVEDVVNKLCEEIEPEMEQIISVRQKRIEQIFAETKAIITHSHIVYKAGGHGEAYVNKDAIYPFTEKIAELCKYIAENFRDIPIDTVIAPAVGGVILSQWVSFYLTKMTGKVIHSVYADKDGNSFIIKRGYDKYITGKNVLIVEDIINTGGSLKGVGIAVKGLDGNIVGIGALCNRGGITAKDLGIDTELYALMNVTLQMYKADECPLCRENVPINTEVGHGKEFLAK